MASISQLVSEIAHSIKQPDSIPVKRAIKLAIIHSRNTLIRQSVEQHGYTDKSLQQRYKLTLINVPDGDIPNTENIIQNKIKRTKYKVNKPTRLTNNLPFHSVRTIGVKNPIEIAFVKEASSKFYKELPGMCPNITYDYINGYIYINIPKESSLMNLGSIIVESVFEIPTMINEEELENGNIIDSIDENDEFAISEDMVQNIKKLTLETWNAEVIRTTNEIPATNIIM